MGAYDWIVKNTKQAFSNMGDTLSNHPNQTAYLLDQVGTRLNPNGPLAGIGTHLARSNQFRLAQEHARSRNQQLSKMAMEMLGGQYPLTPAEQEGLTSIKMSPGKDGKFSQLTMNMTLPAEQERVQNFNASINPDSQSITLQDANGSPINTGQLPDNVDGNNMRKIIEESLRKGFSLAQGSEYSLAQTANKPVILSVLPEQSQPTQQIVEPSKSAFDTYQPQDDSILTDQQRAVLAQQNAQAEQRYFEALKMRMTAGVQTRGQDKSFEAAQLRDGTSRYGIDKQTDTQLTIEQSRVIRDQNELAARLGIHEDKMAERRAKVAQSLYDRTEGERDFFLQTSSMIEEGKHLTIDSKGRKVYEDGVQKSVIGNFNSEAQRLGHNIFYAIKPVKKQTFFTGEEYQADSVSRVTVRLGESGEDVLTVQQWRTLLKLNGGDIRDTVAYMEKNGLSNMLDIQELDVEVKEEEVKPKKEKTKEKRGFDQWTRHGSGK